MTKEAKMKRNVAIVVTVGFLTVNLAVAQQKESSAAKAAANVAKNRRTADGHPDLSGLWTFAISIPPGAISKVVNGQKTVLQVDRSARYFQADVPGGRPWAKEPSYKPELRAK